MFTALRNKTTLGFTLLEVMVVVAIIGIFAVVITVNSVQSGQQGRDAKRQADIRALQSAVELYKNKNGRYPVGCRGADQWAGQQGTSYACPGGSTQYIVDLAPEFIPVLPLDKKLPSGIANSGYVYRTNAAGTVFKIMAMNTVEGESVPYSHPLKSCDIIPASNGAFQFTTVNQIDIGGWCNQATAAALDIPGVPTSVGPLPNCRRTGDGMSTGRFERSYGVWGGFMPLQVGINQASRVRDTTAIICK